MTTHIQNCGYVHPPTTATCKRCHYPIYRMNGSWFSCPMHMGGSCYTARLPTGEDVGVRHVPFETEEA